MSANFPKKTTLCHSGAFLALSAVFVLPALAGGNRDVGHWPPLGMWRVPGSSLRLPTKMILLMPFAICLKPPGLR